MSLRALFFVSLLVLLPASSRAQVTATSLWQNTKIGGGPRQTLVLDSVGNIVATDGANKSLRVFRPSDAATNASQRIMISGVSTTTGYPNAVAVNAATGHVYANIAATSGTLNVYQYDVGAGTSSKVSTVTPFVAGNIFKTLDQLCFSPDGSLLFASFSATVGSGNTAGILSIIRVAQRGPGDTWTDTNVVISPGHNTVNTADYDPRNNQGACYGLAADAGGNLWVASASDPAVWNGSTASQAQYAANAAAYVRPLRYYRRQADGSYVLAAEIPLTQKAAGIALASDGTLYVAEGRTKTANGTESSSHRVHVYRGLTRVGTIETAPSGGSQIWNLQSIAISADGNPTVVGNVGNGTGGAAMQQWSVTGLPAAPMGTIQGKITDATTGKPVSGATVRAFTQAATTDALGNYTLTAPVTGMQGTDPFHVVTVDAPGYWRTQRRPVRLATNATADMELAPSTTAASGMNYFVETTLGAVETQAGLARVEAAAGDSTIGSIPPGTDNARVMAADNTSSSLDPNANANSVPDRNLFFDIDDGFAAGGDPTFVSVRWLDDLGGKDRQWSFQYRAVGEQNQTSIVTPRRGSGEVRTASAYLKDPNLSGPLTSGADFNLLNSYPNGSPVTVVSVAVTKGIPKLLNAQPPTFAPVGNTSDGTIVTAPIIYDGILYAGTAGKAVYATDAGTGAPVTSFGTTGNGLVSVSQTPVGRPVIFRTPDGVAHLCVVDKRTTVYVLHAKTGAIEWSSAPVEGFACAAAPLVYVDTSTGAPIPLIYIGTTYTRPGGGAEGRLQRYRAGAGGTLTIDMELAIGTEITSSPALNAGMDRVMVGYTDGSNGHVLITDNPRVADGGAFTPKVDFAVSGEPVRASPTLTGDGRTMLIGSSNGATGHLHAANAANAGALWSIPMGGVETTPWVDYEAYGNAAQADTAFVCSVDGMIHSINLTNHTERPGFPIRPVPGVTGGSLMVLNRKLYVGCDIGMLVMDPTNPTSLQLFSPAYVDALKPAAQRDLTAPGFNLGVSASGRVAGSSVIAMTGSNQRLYEMYVQ